MPNNEPFVRYLKITFIVFVTVIGSVWFYTQHFPMLFEESGYLVWRAKFNAVASCSTGPHIILGDSRAQAAFVPAIYGPQSYNLALGGSTPLEAYLVFKKLSPCLVPGQHIILSIAPNGFAHLTAWLWENGARYGFVDFSDLRELATGAASVHDDSFAQFETRIGSGLVRDVIYGLHFPSLYANNLLSARLMLRGDINRDLLARAEARRGYLPFGFRGGAIAPVPEARDKHFHTLPVTDFFLHKLVRLAADKNVHIDFVAAPLSELSNEAYTDTYKAEFTAYLKAASATSGGALRVIEPLFYAYPNALFSDASHVGEEGAKRFTRWLAQCRENSHCNHANGLNME